MKVKSKLGEEKRGTQGQRVYQFVRGGIQIARRRDGPKPAAYPPQVAQRELFRKGIEYAKDLTGPEIRTLREEIEARGRRTSWYNYAKRSCLHPGRVIVVYDGWANPQNEDEGYRSSLTIEHPLLKGYRILLDGVQVKAVTGISNLATGRIEHSDQTQVDYYEGQLDVEIQNTAGLSYLHERVVPVKPPFFWYLGKSELGVNTRLG